MERDVQGILEENARRNARMFARFDPYTGEGSTGDRVEVVIGGLPVERQHIPVAMLEEPLVRRLVEAGSVGALVEEEFGDVDTERYAEVVVEEYVRVRCRHDFAFWAASFCKVKRKGGGDDVYFRLTYPQRKFVERLERFRLSGRPIRLVLLKARQWGGSTTCQLYMAWLQLMHKAGLNSLIISQVKDASLKIKDMFRRMLASYPTSLLYDIGEGHPANAPKLERMGGSDNTQRVPQRNCTISVGTAEEPDSVRSGDYSLVHCSEVGLWKTTPGRKPEDIVRSACSGVLYAPLTMIVYESTANGVGNFFHQEYVAASDAGGGSQFEAMFVPWYDIELYRLGFDDEGDEERFARELLAGRESDYAATGREQPGKYLWWLWERGATLEGIRWYKAERAKYHSHSGMASEYPSDDVEAFVNTGADVFDRYKVDALKAGCRDPRWVGEVTGDGHEGKRALQGLRFSEDTQGSLEVWEKPERSEPGDAERVVDRYLTVVDVGGRGAKADWSVVAVLDRLYMADGGRPVVVAQWRGHCDIDQLAWRAAQIAAWYDNSLLVIESNTLETHDATRQVEGDQSQYILNQIRDVYPNLYARAQSPEDIRNQMPRRYGFHTNTATKPMVISTLVKCVRDGLYVERDRRALAELLNYERKANGSYGAVAGQHDDILMTRAIGLHVCFQEMPLPRVVTSGSMKVREKPIGESTI